MALLTINELAARVLHKLRVLDPLEPAKPDDLVKAVEGVEAAHSAFKVEGLVRWTLVDIPDEVQMAYILMGAALCASDYGAVADPNWPTAAIRMVAAHVHIPIGGPSCAENF